MVPVASILSAQQLQVRVNEVQVVLWRGVVLAAQLGRELLTVVLHTLVDHDHVADQVLLLALGNELVFAREKGGGDGEEGLLGPRHEPVDDGVVDEAGKVAAAGAQGVADGRHGQHDVQVVGALGDEVLEDALLGRAGAVLARFVADLADDAWPEKGNG